MRSFTGARLHLRCPEHHWNKLAVFLGKEPDVVITTELMHKCMDRVAAASDCHFPFQGRDTLRHCIGDFFACLCTLDGSLDGSHGSSRLEPPDSPHNASCDLSDDLGVLDDSVKYIFSPMDNSMSNPKHISHSVVDVLKRCQWSIRLPLLGKVHERWPWWSM